MSSLRLYLGIQTKLCKMRRPTAEMRQIACTVMENMKRGFFHIFVNLLLPVKSKNYYKSTSMQLIDSI